MPFLTTEIMKSLNPLITIINGKFAAIKTALKQIFTKSKHHFDHIPNAVGMTLTLVTKLHHHSGRLRRKKPKAKVKKIRFNYSTELIPQLLGGHQEILRQVSIVDNDAYEKNLRSAFENLLILIYLLKAQISLEKSKLYPYLQKTLINNIDAYTTMRNLRKKTDRLAQQIAVMEIKYNQMRNNPSLIEQLEGDNTKLSMLLVNNFQEIETSLYPLYQPGA